MQYLASLIAHQHSPHALHPASPVPAPLRLLARRRFLRADPFVASRRFLRLDAF